MANLFLEPALTRQIKCSLPNAMRLPEPFEKLFNWVETNNLTWVRDDVHYGWITTHGEMKSSGAPYIEFSAQGSKYLKHWFGHDLKELHDRLYVFSQTGAEGSMGAFWLDDQGNQKIVHLGGGSGSIMTCVLTDNAIDFLRLLAIGYDEICWGEFNSPPTHDIPINTDFRKWVETEFSVTIPVQGDEIVNETAKITDAKTSADPFLKWVTKMLSMGEYA